MRTQRPGVHRIRTSCDICYRGKMKCSRGNPCDTCARLGHSCSYSPSNRLGRPPKGQARKGKVRATTDDAAAKSSQSPDQSTIAMSPTRDDTTPEDLPTLDDMFMDVSLDPLPYGQALPHGGASSNAPYDTNTVLLPFSGVFSQLAESLQGFGTSDGHYGSSQSSSRDDIFPHPGRGCCNCLQQHSQFLCELKSLDNEHHSITLDAARDFLKLWHTHLRCISCWNDEDKGALMLSMTSLAVVVERLRRFIGSLRLQVSPQEFSSCDVQEFSAVAPNIFASGTTSRQSSTKISGSIRRSSIAFPMDSMSSLNLVELSIPEEDHRAVASMLIMRILGRIRNGLSEVRQRLNNTTQDPRQGSQACLLLGTLGPTVVESLDNTVEHLEQSVRSLLLDPKEP
ncbi:hypothetical protein GGR51DRAFT_111345 [Nemania sp. FL0031]|nr:hypothetical protein GGR51DRAFT_111345 [Nemania sp. FL0031]